MANVKQGKILELKVLVNLESCRSSLQYSYCYCTTVALTELHQ